MDKYTDSLNSLRAYVEKEGFRGYDPYDTLNSPLPFGLFGNFGKVAAIQLQKRNPVNIRPLLGIRKEFNPKAIGLFLYSYSLLYKKNPDQAMLEKMNFFFDWLSHNYTKGYSGHCWGYNFVWASRQKTLERFHPSVVVTSFVCKGIYQYYLATGDKRAVEILGSASKYILNDLPISETKDGICFSYTDVIKDCCYNASLLGAEVLAMLFSITGEKRLKEMAMSATDFVVAHQHDDGHWNYDIDLSSGKEKKQIDFHQGYVIDSISEVMKHCDAGNLKYDGAVRNGLDFYFKNQFAEEGRSYWRIPKKYPVEIHNQSQGIITFTRAAKYDPAYLPFAKAIADFTIDQMQDKTSGHFYYRLLPQYKITTPFMRWSQAWMMLALSELTSAH
jgi:rhamnogalacturonyl hydrolase YesR